MSNKIITFLCADEDLKSEQTFDTSEFLIKREVPDEPPQMSDDLVDLDQHSRDYIYPAVVKVKTLWNYVSFI